ncbi:TPA: hypothetical protein ACK3Q6_006358 [Burkholderia cepacia]|uniref:hypothetical protein n=1 Tax=Burkholderia cepacia TaxID=292 RepID=UPI00299EC11E|nr:hypothetical protein [Burkholderia cepacia]
MPHDEDRRERDDQHGALARRLTFTPTISRPVILVPTMLTSTTVGWQIHGTSQCVRNCIHGAIASCDAIAMRADPAEPHVDREKVHAGFADRGRHDP